MVDNPIAINRKTRHVNRVFIAVGAKEQRKELISHRLTPRKRTLMVGFAGVILQ
jgi:hypothetical protein